MILPKIQEKIKTFILISLDVIKTMISIRKKLTSVCKEAFEKAGYSGEYGEVSYSDRPDLSQFQVNGAFSLAKAQKTNPKQVAQNVIKHLKEEPIFKEVFIAGPGFINIIVTNQFLAEILTEMNTDEHLGIEQVDTPRKILIDYGGPNVGKPLHVGHLRTAIIGETLKRITRVVGHEVVADIHLGDWGLQMGMILLELQRQHPEWIYFDPNFKGPYPQESPIDYQDFEKTYPVASKRAKENPEIMEQARLFTKKLQQGEPGFRALWKHFVQISVNSLKKSYNRLCVDFDLWLGESDVQEDIVPMVEVLKKRGFAYMSEGAWVVDVKKEDDTFEVPPFMLSKSDGSSLYSTTDLATLAQRMRDFNPHEVWYVVDSRQSLHFTQLFRCAHKTQIVPNQTKLHFLGFGTMNGKDGKPFKTRDGGVMQLDDLIEMVETAALKRLHEEEIGVAYLEHEKKEIAHKVGMAALKYADLMNHRTKDYVFDLDRFLSFEGRTGAYLLYSVVRMKSILRKAKERSFEITSVQPAINDTERALQLRLSGYSDAINRAFEEKAPNILCEYVYQLAADFNRFYHDSKILTESDEKIRGGWLACIQTTLLQMERSLDLLGISAPEKL